jgi:hypothetical protein
VLSVTGDPIRYSHSQVSRWTHIILLLFFAVIGFAVVSLDGEEAIDFSFQKDYLVVGCVIGRTGGEMVQIE